jgi:hypothetical protein
MNYILGRECKIIIFRAIWEDIIFTKHKWGTMRKELSENMKEIL